MTQSVASSDIAVQELYLGRVNEHIYNNKQSNVYKSNSFFHKISIESGNDTFKTIFKFNKTSNY